MPECVRCPLALALVMVVVFPLSAAASSPTASEETVAEEDSTRPDVAYRLRAHRADRVPSIDGRLTDRVWGSADAATDFTQFKPNPGAPASRPTRVRIAYDETALYVGARLLDDPDSVVARTARRDQFGYSDRFFVFFDSYDDDRTAFGFGVTPAGSRFDAFYSDGTNEDTDWDAVWQAETRVDSSGWTVEMRIPLSQLQFDPVPADESATWGLNFLRDIARYDERVVWSPLNPEAAQLVSRFGALHGLQGLPSTSNLEIEPYVTARATRDAVTPENPFSEATAWTTAVGGDVEYSLTPNLSLHATINPTFGQVEADPSKVNLSAYETFFPEKRPFFVEGADLFSVQGPRLFYSRRIGRTPQGSAPERADHTDAPDRTTILGAAKMTGRTSGGWEIGALEAVTAPEHASFVDEGGETGEAVVEPTTSYGLARIRKNLRGGKSTVGGILTMTNRPGLPSRLQHMHDAAYTGGLDGRHRFADEAYEVSGAFYGSQVRGSRTALQATQGTPTHYFQRPDASHLSFDSTRTQLTGWNARAAIDKIEGTWQWDAAVAATSPGFEINDLGYLRRADALTERIGGAYVNSAPGDHLRRVQGWLRHEASWTFGGERTKTEVSYGAFATLANNHSIRLGGTTVVPSLSTTALRGGPALRTNGATEITAAYETDSRKAVQVELTGRVKTESGTDGYEVGVQSAVRYRPSQRASLSLAPSFQTGLDTDQYVGTVSPDLGEDGGASDAPRYVFGQIQRRTLSVTAEASYAFTPEMTLEVYAQPFVASGDYRRFAEVEAPQAKSYDARFDALADRLSLDEETGRYRVGDSSRYSFSDPDFTLGELRSTVVFRWQYRPGSTLYLVWNHDQTNTRRDARFEPVHDMGSTFAGGRNTFGVKLTYWLGL